MIAEDRLRRIRSIIRETERQMDDDPNCDQLPLLRIAFMDIIMAVGPQKSGNRLPRERKVMKLENCPLCQVVEHGVEKEGEFCVKGAMGYHPFDPKSLLGDKPCHVTVVTLKDHDTKPTPEAIQEAMKMIQPTSGMVEEIRDVAGHWALWVMPGNWTSSGKSSGREN